MGLGESLINPDCLSDSSSAAALFYAKQAGFAALPFVAVCGGFVFWYAYGLMKGTPFYAKRPRDAGTNAVATPKDKFVLTVGYVVYLLFPTLCGQAFRVFDCITIAGKQYLAVDLEHPCYESDHLLAVLTLGLGQLFGFVLGLPALVLLFLRRNRLKPGGPNRRVVQIRYGLF